ncbi:GNAT family N-acetyltransferase [Solwaraspora sp. WMMA2101]|uniref:GNAT family N-acetyltransferase n=1 Tax=Solwaraspora sp. WMMA2101 TaxID=3404124 RepID=UPI003B92AFA1
MVSIMLADGHQICDDPTRVDVDRVHDWLSTDAYWALGRPREVVARSIANSLVFGVYRGGDGGQVGFARVVTDQATFGWLCDVYIDRSVRGRGLGRRLVAAARDELARRGVRRLLLGTLDAHGVYAALGFAPLAEPGRWMELTAPPTADPALGR